MPTPRRCCPNCKMPLKDPEVCDYCEWQRVPPRKLLSSAPSSARDRVPGIIERPRSSAREESRRSRVRRWVKILR